MRKTSIILIAIISLLYNLQAGENKEYKILKISGDSIYIGNKWCRKDSTFVASDKIYWKPANKLLCVQGIQDRHTYYFSQEAMKAKNAKTVKDYVVRLSKMSSKDGIAWQNLMGKNKKMFTEKRIALVIGNSNYQNNTQLQNPLNDATIVSEELQELGFDVICLYDGTGTDMDNAIEAFRNKAAIGNYKIAFFYYSGHGLQDDGRNWLLPVDAALNSPADLKRNCIEGQWLLSKLEDTHCGNTIVVLDACRNEKLNWTRGIADGLVSMEPYRGMCLAYSTRAGEVAQDIVNDNIDNGPYAISLVAALKKSELTVDEIFNEVKGNVIKITSMAQAPIHFNGAINTIYINGRNKFLDEVETSKILEGNDFSKIVELAKQGNKDAQYEVGVAYEFGLRNCARDMNEAVLWYGKAAAQGHNEAKNKFGSHYYSSGNYDEAIKWFKSAADGGNENAQYNLGFIYIYIMNNYADGISWMRLAANSGHADAQFELGLCYYNGTGVTKYRTEAVKYFTDAADQNHHEAQYYLGLCYFKGEGVEQDYLKAFHYFFNAAAAGLPEAQYQLCLCYEKGYGVNKNMKYAVEWCERASAQNYEKATRKLSHLPSGK